MTSAANTTTPTMTAIVQDTYGTAEVLERHLVSRPDIGDTEVRSGSSRPGSTLPTGRS